MRIHLSKQEKIVIISGILILAILTAVGLLTNVFSNEDEYIAKDNKTTHESVRLELKQEKFAILLNTKVNTDAEYYFTNESSVLKNIRLDISKVETSKTGTYDVIATYNNKEVKIPLIVAESLDPVITAERTSIEFILEDTSNIQEIIDYANVTAKDVYGNDLKNAITGWETELPTTNLVKTYNLQVKDKEGRTSKLDITVSFFAQTNSNNGNNNTDTDNPENENNNESSNSTPDQNTNQPSNPDNNEVTNPE